MKAHLFSNLTRKLNPPSNRQPKTKVSNTTLETPLLHLTPITAIMVLDEYYEDGANFSTTCSVLQDTYTAVTNTHVRGRHCVQHELPFMTQDGIWYNVDGSTLRTQLDSTIGLLHNPTVSKGDKVWYFLGSATPGLVIVLAFTAVGSLVHYMHVRKKQGLPYTPLWMLAAWRKIKERKGFRGSKEGRAMRMEDVEGGAGARSEV
ncbi:MAG: hypothetical protein LQ349_004179 [Xanthoria aureola]|nr:MAG: hypothetical protein LQ349_004179 [Xanthoria aureola]